MTMEQQPRVYRMEQGQVETATQAAKKTRDGGEVYVWKLKLKCPSISEYAITTDMSADCAARVVANEFANVCLMRGRLRNQDQDGSRDFHYWWEVATWNGVPNSLTPQPPADYNFQQPPIQRGQSPGGASPTHSASAGSNNNADKWRSKEEIRWTEAWKMATRLAAIPHFSISGMDDLLATATTINNHLDSVNPRPPEPPPPPPRCEQHNVEYDKTSGKSGKIFHHVVMEGETYACIHGDTELLPLGI